VPSEALPCGQGNPGDPVDPSQQIVAGEEQLVDVGVRVAAVDEAFAPGAGGKLAFADRSALEIDGREQAQPRGAGDPRHEAG
jgi:hypothetical protein